MDKPRKTKRSTIRIDGDKLRSLLENTTGKTIYELSLENGFSKNLISEACRSGYASAIVQSVAKLYGISPEAYKIVETEDKEPSQISIDEIAPAPQISREEIKDAIKDAAAEMIPEFTKILTKAIEDSFKKACFDAFEENVPYLVAEFGKSSKGNIKAAVRETLIGFGWNYKNQINGGKK